MEHYDILIIGGGAAGISAAKECIGARVLLAESREKLGGVLLQCSHHGFGNNLRCTAVDPANYENNPAADSQID